MNYKETLFFVGECLTLDHHPEKVGKIRDVIRSKEIDWEQIVWISSNQLVLPALYLNLKRAALLSELDKELIQHLEKITSLNRERNLEIVKQAEEITNLLNQHDIAPVFLKGTAHLLNGLYIDMAERMVGDIDFLLDKKDVIKVAKILMDDGYTILEGLNPDFNFDSRHYPRLVCSNAIAGLEIHWTVVEKSFSKHFNFDLLDKRKKLMNTNSRAFILSPSHQLIYNMMIVQMNDGGYYLGSVYLKHMYDLLLLSQANNPLKTLTEFGFYFNRLNAYLNLSAKIMGEPLSLSYKSTWQSKLFLRKLNFHIAYTKLPKFIRIILYVLFRMYNYHKILVLAIFVKKRRVHLLWKITNPTWFKKHLQSYMNMT